MTRTSRKAAFLLAAVLFALGFLPASPAAALDSSWNSNAAGNWSDAAKWTVGVPDGIGDIARLTFNITTSRTVTIDGSSRTVGAIYLNDDNCGYTLGGAGLNLDVSSGSALIQSDGGTGVPHTISAPVTLNDATTIAVNSAALRISGALSSGVAGTGITKTGAGTLVLSGTNIYSGPTIVSAGTLQANDATNLPSNSFLSLDGGVLQGSGTINRPLGISNNSLQWTASGGGFAASSGSLTINVGGNASPTELAWGTAVGSGILGTLMFGSPTADRQTVFRNGIDLNGTTRTIDVAAGAGGDSALLSGVIRTSTGSAGITKTGAGKLIFGAVNTYNGTTAIMGGTVALSAPGTLVQAPVVIGDASGKSGNLDLGNTSGVVTDLTVGSNSSNTNTISIASGRTFTVTGDFNVGANALNSTTNLTMTGGGAFIQNNPGGTFQVGANNLIAGSDKVNINMSGLSSATINLGSTGTFRVSDGGSSTGYTGYADIQVTLPTTTKITAQTVIIGDSGRYSGQDLVLGSGANEINADTIQVGSGDVACGSLYLNSAGTLKIRAADGIGRANLYVGIGGGAKHLSVTNYVSLAYHTADLLLGTLGVGSGPGGGFDENTFTFSQGLLDVTDIEIANRSHSGTVSNVRIDGGTVNIGAGGIFLAGNSTGSLSIDGGVVTLGGDIVRAPPKDTGPLTATLSLAGGTLDMGGHDIVASTGTFYRYFRSGTLMNVGHILGDGGLVKSPSGLLVLAGTNTYTGGTTIGRGVLRTTEGGSLPFNNLKLGGGALENIGPATFTRSLGTGDGQVQWSASGGFSAFGGKLTVAIGGTTNPTPLTWGTNNFVPVGNALILSSAYADSEVEFRNNIDLGGGTQTVNVDDNPATIADGATLSGVLSNGGLIKSGGGRLTLTGANTYGGPTTVSWGILRATVQTSSFLTISGGVLESNGATTLTRSLGTSGANTLQWTGKGGFSAYGGKMTVALGGEANPTPLTWGAAAFIPSGMDFVLGSATADSETEFRNSIDLAGGTGTVMVNDNPSSGGDFATLSGLLSNGALIKDGAGTLALTYANTYAGSTTLKAGLLRANSGVGLPANSNLIFQAGVLESIGNATFARSLGTSGANTVQWTGSAGFAARGGKLTVSLSPNLLTWGSGGFVPTLSTLVFGSTTADNEVDFTSGINLANHWQTIKVIDNPSSSTDVAKISGQLSNGSILKIGVGTLILSGANSYLGATNIQEGVLRANSGAGLPTGSTLIFEGGVLEGLGTATFSRSLGSNDPSRVVWLSNGGFAAHGGKLTVSLTPYWLEWGANYFVPSGATLVFGSTTADSEVELANGIGLDGVARTVRVIDNPSTSADVAKISGQIYNGGLVKEGGGTLSLSATNTYTGPTTISGGALRAWDGWGVSWWSNLELGGGVFESAGASTFTRVLGATGWNTLRWSGSGGFSASAGKLTVAIGGTGSPTPLVWGSGDFVPLGSTLMFGSPTADSETELKNAIDLAGGERTIFVDDNPFSEGDFATISGALSNGSLTKTGPGTLYLTGANTISGASVLGGSLFVNGPPGSGVGLPLTVGGATLEGTGTINGPVTLIGDATITSTGTLTINSTLNVQGLANQLSSGTVNTAGDVTVEPGAVFIVNGTLGGGTGNLVIYGTLMGKGTINKDCIVEAGGVLSPGSPSSIETMAQMQVGGATQNLSFEIGAASPNYASPSNSINDLVRLTSVDAPFADATGSAAALGAADVIDVYFLSSDPALGSYEAQFFAATDFTESIAGATFQYWRLDPHGSRYHNGNLYSPLDESLVDWSVVPETAVFDGLAASGYITEFTVVPEPASAALFFAGLVCAYLRRRAK